MDLLYSPSKIRTKSIQVVFVDDNGSASSSFDTTFEEIERDPTDFIIFESESFVSTSDELIEGSSDDSEINSDVETASTMNIFSEEKSISSIPSFSDKIKGKDKIREKSKYVQNNASSAFISSDDNYSSQIPISGLYSSQIDSSTSYFSSSKSHASTPLKLQSKNNFKRKKKIKGKKKRSNYVDDLDDFIEQDEYDFEEEEMNSSDRRFVTSQIVDENISMYRLFEISKQNKKVKSAYSESSSTSDSESSTSTS